MYITMNKLEEYRKKVNTIDIHMAELFEQRMRLTHDIAIFKMENDLPIYDATREKFVLNSSSVYIVNHEFKSYYSDFLKSLMNISLKYQGKIINDFSHNENK